MISIWINIPEDIYEIYDRNVRLHFSMSSFVVSKDLVPNKFRDINVLDFDKPIRVSHIKKLINKDFSFLAKSSILVVTDRLKLLNKTENRIEKQGMKTFYVTRMIIQNILERHLHDIKRMDRLGSAVTLVCRDVLDDKLRTLIRLSVGDLSNIIELNISGVYFSSWVDNPILGFQNYYLACIKKQFSKRKKEIHLSEIQGYLKTNKMINLLRKDKKRDTYIGRGIIEAPKTV